MSDLLGRARRDGKLFLNPVPTSVGGPTMIFRALPLLLFNREERVPRSQLGPFHTGPSVYAAEPGSGLRMTWFGHSSMLVEIDGVRILIDPLWDRRASPVSWGGPKRFYAPTLAIADLPELDAILISHDHYDHLGASTVRSLAQSPVAGRARWITSLGVGPILSKLGVAPANLEEMDWTGTTSVVSARTGKQCRIDAWPARHFSGRSLGNRFHTLWSSFVLSGEQHRVYFGADTGYWEGVAEIARQYPRFDVTMLEIGAFNELWRDIHLGPDGARRAFREMPSPGLLMPIHWGLFNLALHGWRQPIERLTTLADEAGVKLWSPTPGEPSEVISGQPLRSDWWRQKP